MANVIIKDERRQADIEYIAKSTASIQTIRR